MGSFCVATDGRVASIGKNTYKQFADGFHRPTSVFTEMLTGHIPGAVRAIDASEQVTFLVGMPRDVHEARALRRIRPEHWRDGLQPLGP